MAFDLHVASNGRSFQNSRERGAWLALLATSRGSRSSAPRAVGGGSLSRVLVSEVVNFAEIAPREHSCLSLTDTTECLTPEHPPSQSTAKWTILGVRSASPSLRVRWPCSRRHRAARALPSAYKARDLAPDSPPLRHPLIVHPCPDLICPRTFSSSCALRRTDSLLFSFNGGCARLS